MSLSKPKEENKQIHDDGSNGDTEGNLSWLASIMRKLLAPEGCPWDQKQSLETLKPYLIEECYELIDAIDSKNKNYHTEELGDVLLQLVFQAALADISLRDIILSIGHKLIRRHPHVFGDKKVANADDVVKNWDKIKAEEKKLRPKFLLASIPKSLPSLHHCNEILRKVRKVGFRFNHSDEAKMQFEEELNEVNLALSNYEKDASAKNAKNLEHELGDLLFACAAWAHYLGFQPEDLLRKANKRFSDRFFQIEEEMMKKQINLEDLPREKWIDYWKKSKQFLSFI